MRREEYKLDAQENFYYTTKGQGESLPQNINIIPKGRLYFFIKIFFFFDVDFFFKSLTGLVTILLLFHVLGFSGQEACGILASQPGIRATAPAS